MHIQNAHETPAKRYGKDRQHDRRADTTWTKETVQCGVSRSLHAAGESVQTATTTHKNWKPQMPRDSPAAIHQKTSTDSLLIASTWKLSQRPSTRAWTDCRGFTPGEEAHSTMKTRTKMKSKNDLQLKQPYGRTSGPRSWVKGVHALWLHSCEVQNQL